MYIGLSVYFVHCFSSWICIKAGAFNGGYYCLPAYVYLIIWSHYCFTVEIMVLYNIIYQKYQIIILSVMLNIPLLAKYSLRSLRTFCFSEDLILRQNIHF